MKSLFRLAVVVLLLLAAGAFALRDSPWWTPLEIQRGLEEHNVSRVERVVAFERFSASSTALLGSLLALELGVGGDDAGSKTLAALVGVVAGQVGAANSREAAQQMRKAIREGRLDRSIGPFHINDGLAALGDVRLNADGATLQLKGRCGDVDASLVLLLERHDDGPFGGRPRRYVVSGIEADSGRTLAQQCRAASTGSKSAKTPTPSKAR